MVEVPADQVNQQYYYLLEFEAKADAFELAINMMRPNSSLDSTKSVVSRLRFQQIQQQLETQFIKPQLIGYVNMMHQTENAPRAPKTTTKPKLIEYILKNLWKVEISEEIHERMDLIVEKKLEMSKEDIFFLMSHSMHILYLRYGKTVLTKKMQMVEFSVIGPKTTMLVLQSTLASPHCLLKALW